MRFKVVGTVLENGERRKIIYDEFGVYSDAYDYKEWLEDKDNWKGNTDKQPYMVVIEETDTEDETTGYENIDGM